MRLAASSKRRPARFLLFTFAAALVSLPAGADWSIQSPIPTAHEIRGVAVPESGHLFLAAEDDSFDDGGALLESSDGGATWTLRDVPESLSSDFHGVFFLDADHGWAWGNENYRTIDGGATWQPLPFLGSTYGMRFFSTAFGVATGNFGAQISRDGGLTWQASPEGIRTFSFQGDVGLGASETGLHRTIDGGDNFVPVRAGEAAAVAFLSPSVAVAIVDETFVRSEDGGTVWSDIGPASGKSRLFALSATVALAFGRTGAFPDLEERLFRTEDGGLTWDDLGDLFDSASSLLGLSFASNGGGVILAADGKGDLHRSIDAGETWLPAFTTPGPRPGFLATTAPIFEDDDTAWYGFGLGFLVRSDDAGATWSQVSSGSGASLHDVAAFAGGDLLAVGDEGTLLTSAGGEMPWVIRGGAGSEPLVAVQTLGGLEAVAVAESGIVHLTTDGGESWSAMSPLPNALTAYDVHFLSSTTGWVTGAGFDGHALFRTTNGGVSWEGVTDEQGTFVALDFAGGRGWALRLGGGTLVSLDGGSSWNVGASLPDPPWELTALDFWDANVGYAIGAAGYAARSEDGGATWAILPTPDASEVFLDLHLVGPDELWLVATDGTVLHTATAGQNWSVIEAGPAGFGNFEAIVASPEAEAWIAGYAGAIRRWSGALPPPLNRPPVAEFDFVALGLAVAFTDASHDPDGTIVSWLWEFGDETTSTEPSPQHTYETPGAYFVQLTVTDDDGDTGIAGAAIFVQPLPGGTFGEFTEVTPLDPLFITPSDEDFWVAASAPADIDGDGDLDLAVLGFYVVYNESVDYRLVLVVNDGPANEDTWDFSYIDLPLGDMTAGSSDLAWGDADGDGDPDLVVGSDGLTVLYRNDGGTLVATDTDLPAYYEDNDQADFDLRSITWADYDNDGDLDLLLPSVFDDEEFEWRTALLRNDGSNGSGGFLFTEIDAGLAPTRHAQSQWADFDGDLDLDLLLVHLSPLTDDGFIRRYRNDGDGVFTGEDVLGSLAVEHGEAQWGDADGDGDMDILVAGNLRELDGTFTAAALRIYRDDGAAFTQVDVLDCPQCEGWFDLSAATWADYDSDGDIDILLAGSWNPGSQIEGRAKIYANVEGTFFPAEDQLPAPQSFGSRGGAFSWLDLDGEGDLDYFIAGFYYVPGGNGLVEAQMHVYRNDTTAENGAPGAPSGLVADVAPDGTVSLGWEAAADDSTPAEALTYELRLARDGAPLPAVRPQSEPGRLSAVDAWTLSGLADGVYTWSIAALDSAYNSGTPAQGFFVVGEPPAAIFADGFEAGNVSAWSAHVP